VLLSLWVENKEVHVFFKKKKKKILFPYRFLVQLVIEYFKTMK